MSLNGGPCSAYGPFVLQEPQLIAGSNSITVSGTHQCGLSSPAMVWSRGKTAFRCVLQVTRNFRPSISATALSQSRPNETGRRPFEQVISPSVLALDLPGCPCHRSNFSRSNDQIQRAFAHLETREVLQRADHKICKRRMDKCKHRANSQS